MESICFVPVPGFVDNYFWLLHRNGQAVVVDPGDAKPVLRALDELKLKLAAILITHHHYDHIGGLSTLVQTVPVPVFGPLAEASTIPGLTQTLSEGETLTVPGLDIELDVWEVPGHTLGHIAYVSREPRFVLCGDTLFSAGCGRLFEGTPEQMHESLGRLRELPPETLVYCTHEYTQANLAFAAAVEPGNAAIAAEIDRVRALRRDGRPSLPSTIARERLVNPFLRCEQDEVRQTASRQSGRRLNSGTEVFAALRRWKDGFQAST